MPRTIKNSTGMFVTLNEADPDRVMRDAQREYYEIPTPQQALIEELLHYGIDRRAFMHEVDPTEEMSFS